jgi:hypothetical protein
MSATCLYCEAAQAERERTGLEYVCPVHRRKFAPISPKCGECGVPIVRDENGIWIDPNSPDDLPMVQCAGSPKSYHAYYGEVTP